MRIHQMSDLHLEFNHSFRATNPCDADILMLNGDICVAKYLTPTIDDHKQRIADIFLDFFRVASESYKWVLYIPGNHEHYHGTYVETAWILGEALKQFPNIIVLDNDFVWIDDCKFIGSTLWTDCGERSTLTMEYLKTYLNDFRIINYTNKPWKRFTPLQSAIEHSKALEYISEECDEEQKVVIMTHHAPSWRSIHSNYKDSKYYFGNFGYFSKLDDFILERPQIKLWTHGHMHNNFDYMIGDTRVLCNPMGYGMENIAHFNDENIIEI